jgi:hypothetical protein
MAGNYNLIRIRPADTVEPPYGIYERGIGRTSGNMASLRICFIRLKGKTVNESPQQEYADCTL